jgi:APA family basic amino acid/polyamine antiporter
MAQSTESGNNKFIQGLGLLDSTMLVAGSMIGSGIFIVSAIISRQVGAPGWLLVVWLVTGVLTLMAALSYGELAAMMPKAGGQYVYLREAFSPLWGFLYGWTLFLVIQTGTIAAVAVAFAKFLGVLIPSVAADVYLFRPLALGNYAISLSTQQLVAVLLIAALTAANTRGLRLGKLIQNSFTLTKTAALLGLIVVGLTLGVNREAAAWTSSWWDSAANGWEPGRAQKGLAVTGTAALAMLLGRAMIGPLFSQSAWNNVTFTGGEVKDPGRNLPRALILGCGSVIILYLLANVAYLVTLSLPEIQDAPQDRVGTAVMKAVFGQSGTIVMAVAILISTFGCVNGLILAGSRVYYAMARDGLFFARVGTLNSRHVPATALIAQGVWACLLALPVTVAIHPETRVATYGNLYGQLLEYIIPADVAFYTLMVGAVVALRRKSPDADRPYRTIAYPLPALIYIALAVLVVADFIYMTPETSGIGALIVLTGIPVYLVWSRVARAAK